MVFLRKKTSILFLLTCIPLMSAFADATTATTGGAAQQGFKAISSSIQGQISSFTNLLITVAYIAGVGFTMASIFKFKQHKDNPTQTPIGTPFAMFAVGVILIFLPAMFAPAGYSIFGTTPTPGSLMPLLPTDKTQTTT